MNNSNSILALSELHKDSLELPQVEKLYTCSFPEVECHSVEKLLDVCKKWNCLWLIFKENNSMVGMAYMIEFDDIAFLLYLAVKPNVRNKGYGKKILGLLHPKYESQEIILLIENVHEDNDNMEFRLRRRNFYLRNGYYDSNYVQPTNDGTDNYDITTNSQDFDLAKWERFTSNYPMDANFGKPYKAKGTTNHGNQK